MLSYGIIFLQIIVCTYIRGSYNGKLFLSSVKLKYFRGHRDTWICGIFCVHLSFQYIFLEIWISYLSMKRKCEYHISNVKMNPNLTEGLYYHLPCTLKTQSMLELVSEFCRTFVQVLRDLMCYSIFDFVGILFCWKVTKHIHY